MYIVFGDRGGKRGEVVRWWCGGECRLLSASSPTENGVRKDIQMGLRLKSKTVIDGYLAVIRETGRRGYRYGIGV